MRSRKGGSFLEKRIYNKTDRPDNIVQKENELLSECSAIEEKLPAFLRDYFIFLKHSVAIRTRLAYLQDIYFFMQYLIESDGTGLFSSFEKVGSITEKSFNKLRARDINYYIGEYCARYEMEQGSAIVIYENHNRSLSRKKSSLNSMFKFLFRNDQMKENISAGFNPIKMPKVQPDGIKRLTIDETNKLFHVVRRGDGLTAKELQYWEKTKKRDFAMISLFVIYGLRLSELQQLNLSSFNRSRGEFRIFRKRGKEILMPIKSDVQGAIDAYIQQERAEESFIAQEHKDALFLSLQGERMTSRAIQNLIKKYTAVVMGTTAKNGYSPHKLRATAASSLLEFGFSIYDVQELLDHENVTTTQLYAAHRKYAKKEIIDELTWLKEE